MSDDNPIDNTAPASETESVTAPSPADPSAPVSTELDRAAGLAESIRNQIGRAVVAQDAVIEEVLAALIAGGHVLLEGVPGLGKTLIVLALGKTFGGVFSRIQFTPDLMPTDVIGHTIWNAASGEFQVRKGPAFAHLLLADEINRAPAKTQAALLEVMQEQQISIEGQSFRLDPPFMTLATQNPIEQEGTYPLPEAQLDRFLLKVRVGYPDEREELDLVRLVTSGRVGDNLDVSAVEQVAEPSHIVALQRQAAKITVDERILAYAVEICRQTRSWRGLRFGTGPRGAIALIRVARAVALMEARDFVVPDDIKRMGVSALAHRIQVAPELEIEGLSAEDVIAEVLDQVEAPRT